MKIYLSLFLFQKGLPSVLKIYQQGGMFKRNAAWKEFVFKISEGKLQYQSLKGVRIHYTLILRRM